MKIEARIYGTVERMGAIKRFEVVDTLPEQGERVDLGDPGYVWDEPQKVRLDHEQGTPDDDLHDEYDFYVVWDIDTETGEQSSAHYMAVMV